MPTSSELARMIGAMTQVAPPVGSSAQTNISASQGASRPKRRKSRTVSQEALDPQRSESRSEAEIIQERNRQIRAANAARRGKG